MTRIAIVILAKNERDSIAESLDRLAKQNLFSAEFDSEILIIPNGCTDDTADIARRAAGAFSTIKNCSVKVQELEEGGKSRSWNRAVHEFVDPATEYLIFMDADIECASDCTILNLLRDLQADPRAQVYSGLPVKHLANKPKKSLLDRFSMLISRGTRYSNAINGSLYVARKSSLSDVWLPDHTPGEDGFLDAMIKTRGFSQRADPALVRQARQPTHYFQSHSVLGFFQHERRMIIGTMINRWIFEYFWSLGLKEPAGPTIALSNAERPDWVQRIITDRTRARRWLISRSILLGRLKAPGEIGWGRFLLTSPAFLLATLLTLPPAIMANAALHRRGAENIW